MKKRRTALLASSLALAACVSAPPIEPTVVTPPKTAGVYTEVQLLPPEVASRESDAKARQQNADLARLVTDDLQKALGARGKTVGNGGRYAVSSRVHIVYKATRIKLGEQVRYEPGSVEVKLVLEDRNRDETAYATLTKTRFPTTMLAQWFGPSEDEIIRQTLQSAITDFVSRL